MDTNKIREALEAVNEYFIRVANDERVTGWVHREDYGLYCLLADPDCGPQVDEALAELDKAQQPGKVLTEEEIESAARDHDASFAHQRSFREGARYVRDNGYLAPAAGLTVDEMVEVVLKWVYKSGELDYNLITSLLPEEKEVGETKYVADLRARLTAAIEAKRTA